jgi:hypothetical protein
MITFTIDALLVQYQASISRMEVQMEQALETIQQVYNVTAKFIINYSFQILGAIIILIIGSKLAGWFGRLITGLCEKEILTSPFHASSAALSRS